MSAERSGNGTERAVNVVSASDILLKLTYPTGAEQWADIPENASAGAERGAGGRVAESGCQKIGLSAERQIGRSRSAHMLCT